MSLLKSSRPLIDRYSWREKLRRFLASLAIGSSLIGVAACSSTPAELSNAAPETAAAISTTSTTTTTLPPEFSFTGKITLFSDDDGVSASENGACEGIGGYNDIGSLTPVKVMTFDERIVARGSLGVGTLMTLDEVMAYVIENDLLDEDSVYWRERGIKNRYETGHIRWCTFSFDFTLVEGSDGGDGYIVSVGDRGEIFLSEDELKRPGAVDLSLG